jgi:hypothetical protein
MIQRDGFIPHFPGISVFSVLQHSVTHESILYTTQGDEIGGLETEFHEKDLDLRVPLYMSAISISDIVDE